MPLMTGQSEAVGGEVDDDYVLDPKGIAILGDPIVGVEVVTLDERGPGALAARALASPNEPTPAARAAHNLTHATYKSRCAICSRACLKEDPRYRQTKEEVKK